MLKISTITLSISLLSSLCFAQDSFNNGLSPNHTYEKNKSPSEGIDIINGWLLLGDIRGGYVAYDYTNPAPSDPSINKGHTDSNGIYVVPKLSILSPKYNNFSAKVSFAGVTDFGINDEDAQSRNLVFDPNENKSFSLLQELYITYENGAHKALVGRQELSTPMIDSDDWYLLANSFEVAYYANRSIENVLIAGGYFHKMAGVWDSGANGTEFRSMSDASFVSAQDKENAKDAGIITGTVQYNDNSHHNLEVWNYYATDLYNTLFTQYDFTHSIDLFSYDFGLQYINFKEVGKLKENSTQANGRIIDYSIYSARFNGKFSNGFSFSTGATKFSNGQGQASTLGAWGGYPYFANGMIFNLFEAGSLRNAASYKMELSYDLSKLGFNNSSFSYRYTYFDFDESHSFNANGEAQSSMILNGIKYTYVSDNGFYCNVTYEHSNLDKEKNTFGFRLIGGLTF